jgi:hypothetical protein
MAGSSKSLTARQLFPTPVASYRFFLFDAARPPKALAKENVMSVFLISVATSLGSTGVLLGLRLNVMRLARMSEERRQTA